MLGCVVGVALVDAEAAQMDRERGDYPLIVGTFHGETITPITENVLPKYLRIESIIELYFYYD